MVRKPILAPGKPRRVAPPWEPLGRTKDATGPLLSFHRHNSGGDRRFHPLRVGTAGGQLGSPSRVGAERGCPCAQSYTPWVAFLEPLGALPDALWEPLLGGWSGSASARTLRSQFTAFRFPTGPLILEFCRQNASSDQRAMRRKRV
jgi:hypothetical protein